MQNIIFDTTKRQHAHQRSQKRNSHDSYFLHAEMAEILAERISVTNRQFTKPALLFQNSFSSELEIIILNKAANIKGPFTHVPFPHAPIKNANGDAIFSENLKLPIEKYDLVISAFDLHWMNDLPGAFTQINRSLKPDGLFTAIFPSEGTLDALRECLVEAEMQIRSGATMRVDPFPQVRQLGDLLRRANYKLPVADVEHRTIRYSSIKTLINDLRNIGGTKMSPGTQVAKGISKEIWNKAIKLYNERYSDNDGKFRTDINCTFLSGWKEHLSQQKPLKRGSAQNKLSDFLS